MEWVIIITVLALLQYTWFGVEVGFMRGRHGVKAPAMSGPPEFERAYRIHYNTLEQLVMLLPLMWIFAHLVNPVYAAGFGAIYLVGRLIYRSEYRKDPSTRALGFNLTIVPSVVMALWLLVVAVRNLLTG